jgi:hypothetical protein
MNGYQIKVIMCGSVYRTSPPCYRSGKWMWVSVLAGDSKQKCRNRIVYLFCVSVYDKKYNILVNNGQIRMAWHNCGCLYEFLVAGLRMLQTAVRLPVAIQG